MSGTGRRYPHRRNADDVKVALVLALQRLGLGAQVEVVMKGFYGRFRVDVAVLNGKRQVLIVAEAKRRPSELQIRQRTNYANCGCPALLVLPKTVDMVAAVIWSYVVDGTPPLRAFLIDNRTFAGGDVIGHPYFGKKALEARMVRG